MNGSGPTDKHERKLVAVLCLYSALKPIASWQHCMDYNAASAALSKHGATPAAQVSGGQIPPSANKEKKRALLKQSHFSASFLPPSSSPKTTKQPASPGSRGPSTDSSELSSQGPCLHGNLTPACPNCFAPQPPKKKFKTLCSLSLPSEKIMCSMRSSHMVHDAQAKRTIRAKRLTQKHCRGTSQIARC